MDLGWFFSFVVVGLNTTVLACHAILNNLFVYSPIGEERRAAGLLQESDDLIQPWESKLYYYHNNVFFSAARIDVVHSAESSPFYTSSDDDVLTRPMAVKETELMRLMTSAGNDAQSPLKIWNIMMSGHISDCSSTTNDSPSADESSDEASSATSDAVSPTGDGQSVALTWHDLVSPYVFLVFYSNICIAVLCKLRVQTAFIMGFNRCHQ